MIFPNKKMTIEKFMEFALYDESIGYYTNKNPIGKNGDFITAPEISQLFGEIICIWAVHSWESMGKPNKIAIVEYGAGNGTLIDDFIRTSMQFKDFYLSCNIYIIERSEKLKKTQQNKLSKYTKNVSWVSSLEEIQPTATIIMANEFLDALPIRQFIMKNNKWFEIIVNIENNNLSFDTVKSDIKLEKAKNGSIIEKNYISENIINKVAKHIKKYTGKAIFFDYGYTTPTMKSTLQGVRKHKYADVLSDIGSTDITAHVDFRSLYNISSKLVNTYITTQKEFLYQFGITQRAEILIQNTKNNERKNSIKSELTRLTNDMYPLFKTIILENKKNNE